MLILYANDDGRSQTQFRAKDHTVRRSQREMTQLFDTSTDNIGLHLKNIFGDDELRREATTEESSVVQVEGGREVRRPLTLYNLDAILAVGYRVRSPCGVLEFDQKRRQQEAPAADEAELRSLEASIKRRTRKKPEDSTE